MKSIVEVSARHIHLKEEDFKTLFGDRQLTKRNDLSQKDEFASDLTCEIVGPKGRIVGVRVLGPLRSYSQVEISKTDSFVLGIDAPYLESGEPGGESIKVVGSKSDITDNIAIVAMRHIHLSESQAAGFGLSDGDFVELETEGLRATRLKKIVVRVGKNFDNHIHLDTDDANSAGIEGNAEINFYKEEEGK